MENGHDCREAHAKNVPASLAGIASRPYFLLRFCAFLTGE